MPPKRKRISSAQSTRQVKKRKRNQRLREQRYLGLFGVFDTPVNGWEMLT